MTRHIAVIDIGKTNAKLALVESATLSELAVRTRPNRVVSGGAWPSFDLDGHWEFFLDGLRDFHAEYGVDAISLTTHGAACVLLDADGNLAVPMLDYEHPGPNDLAAEYDAIRPPFAETGSARLPMGLNLGAQLHWLLATVPGLSARVAHVLTYPQYWGWRLTGARATDVTSLGCHTDLWLPAEARFSSLVDRLGLAGKIAPARRSAEVLGPILPALAARTGLRPDTPVHCGIHDSNASLYPYLLGRKAAFSVVSTGTWVVAMAMNGADIALDPARDVLVNVNALGQSVPTARFMGGREYEVIRNGAEGQSDAASRAAVLQQRVMLMPSVEPGSGPFPGRQMAWTAPPQTDAIRLTALSFYLALMTASCLDLIGARGPAIVEGPFARNIDYLDMLAALRPEGVELARSTTGTSVGAALLALPKSMPPQTRRVSQPTDLQALRDYGADWRDRLG